MSFHGQPLLFLVLGLVGGTLIPGASGNPVGPTAVALALALFIALAAILRPGEASLAALIFACGAAGAGLASVERMRYESRFLPASISAVGDAVLVEGRVMGDPRVGADEMRLDMESTAVVAHGVKSAYAGRIRVFVRGVPPSPSASLERARHGDLVRIWMDLRRPASVRTPGGFDQSEWSAREGIHAFGTCKSERLINRLGQRMPEREFLDRARDQLRASWRHVPNETDRAVTMSMVLGDDGALEADIREEFRASGLLHLLVVSGSQVAALILGLRRVMPRNLRRSWSGATLECLILLGYCALAGADNSIVRATVMAIAFAIAVRVDLQRTGANLLAGAALCLLALRPLDARDPGAQLSFAATLALILFAAPVAEWLRARGAPRWFAEITGATLVAAIAVTPLTLIHFHRVSLVALPANLAAAPLAVVLLYGSILTAILDLLAPSLAPFAGLSCGVAASALRSIAHHAAGLDPDWRSPAPPLILLLGLTALFVAPGWRRKVLPLASVLATLTMSSLPKVDGRLHLWFLDVGQGDALLIETPGGQAAVIDAGPAFERFDAGERIVSEALWELGYSRLSFLAVTHRHADHEGGAPFIARHFSPVTVYGNGPSNAMKDFPVTTLKRGDSWTIDGVTFEVLAPSPEWSLPLRDENTRSLVIQIRYGRSAYLILGDASARTERLLSIAQPFQDVVKVGHHGAATSSIESLVHATRPRVALISVGERNRFLHPNPSVVERWKRSGSLIWRTDVDRTLHVTSDGASTSIVW